MKTRNNKAIIFDFMRTLYDPEARGLFYGARDILKYCSQKYDLYLISRLEGQRAALFDNLDIRKYFTEIALVQEKNKNVFTEILTGEESCVYKEVYVIGDVFWDEIAIGNALNYKTIWFKHGKFSDDYRDKSNEKPWRTIHSLSELYNLL